MAFCGKGGIRTSEARLSPVQLLVLTLLKRNPAHGYMILRKLRRRLSGWNLKSGTIYPALHRMVEKGLIVGTDIPQEERPDAVQYRLTPKGERVLQEAFQNIGSEFRVQDSLWRFLGPSFGRDAAAALLNWTSKEKSPFGFFALKRHCESPHCAPIRLDFLKKYREYLKEELKWVDKYLSELKGADKKDGR